MLPVARNYTQQIISNRNSIENTLRQMNDGIYRDANLDFDYQGSVTNNTHIRRNSDVDLLVICNYFITLQAGLPCPDPYRGNPKDDLLTLRNNCVEQLGKFSPKLKIDDSGAKSVKVSGGHLVVSVDVVPANWYETKESYKTKSKNLKLAAEKIANNFGGKVPETMEELMSIPGVGRKSANVIMLEAFNKPQGIAVDTHAKRISNRIGFSSESEPTKIEQDLLKLISNKYYKDVNHVLVWHGRNICTAAKPKCSICPVSYTHLTLPTNSLV